MRFEARATEEIAVGVLDGREGGGGREAVEATVARISRLFGVRRAGSSCAVLDPKVDLSWSSSSLQFESKLSSR